MSSSHMSLHIASTHLPQHPAAALPLLLLQCCHPNCHCHNNNPHSHEDATDSELGLVSVHQDKFFFCFIHFSPLLQSPSYPHLLPHLGPQTSLPLQHMQEVHPYLTPQCLEPRKSLPPPPSLPCHTSGNSCRLHSSPHASPPPLPPCHSMQDLPQHHAIIACKTTTMPTHRDATPTWHTRPAMTLTRHVKAPL